MSFYEYILYLSAVTTVFLQLANSWFVNKWLKRATALATAAWVIIITHLFCNFAESTVEAFMIVMSRMNHI